MCGIFQAVPDPHGKKPIKKGDFKIIRLFNKLKVRTVSEKVVRMHDPELVSFFNVNTPEDLEEAEEDPSTPKYRAGRRNNLWISIK